MNSARRHCQPLAAQQVRHLPAIASPFVEKAALSQLDGTCPAGSRSLLQISLRGLRRLVDMLTARFLLRQRTISFPAGLGYAAVAGNLQLIKALREKSGAPMAEVKAALEEASWDEGKSTAETGLSGASGEVLVHPKVFFCRKCVSGAQKERSCSSQQKGQPFHTAWRCMHSMQTLSCSPHQKRRLALCARPDLICAASAASLICMANVHTLQLSCFETGISNACACMVLVPLTQS